MLSDMESLEAAILWHTHNLTLELDEQNYSRPKVPTHTEDGIPIRKIYVSNLPPKTTREELLQFFAQYGYVKSCWVKSAYQNIKPYAFVTFIDPADAHKALEASQCKCIMRGKVLHVMPADSWHQPLSDTEGNVMWSNKKIIVLPENPMSPTVGEASNNLQQEDATSDLEYNIMDILNHDCLSHVMSYVPIQDLVRSEAVSKRWQAMVYDYFLSLRTFRTSSWTEGKLTTAKLRLLLQRMGPTLTSLHVDRHGYELNGRTARTIGKFCPALERLTIDGMTTKYWNPVVDKCKNLHSLSFISCSEIDDTSLTSLLSLQSSIETLHMSGIKSITGTFLENITPKIQSLTLRCCPNIEGKLVKKALLKLTQLKSLTLNKVAALPAISALAGLAQLEELNLCSLFAMDFIKYSSKYCDELDDALGKMADLKVLTLGKIPFLNDKVLKRIAESCTKLRKLNIIYCNNDNGHSYSNLITIATKCTNLRHLNLSYNAGLEQVIPALSACPELCVLIARGSSTLTDKALVQCILACHQLQEVDVYGCTKITEVVVSTCVAELERRPRRLKLYLGDTAAGAKTVEDMSKHPMLTVDFTYRNCYPSLSSFFGQEMSDDSDYDFDQYEDNLFSEPDFDEDYSVESYGDYYEYDEDQLPTFEAEQLYFSMFSMFNQ